MTAREAFERGTNTFNAHDINGFAAVLADDVVFEAPGIRGEGRAACAEFFGSWFAAFPDARVEVHSLHILDDVAVEEGRFTGTHNGVLRSPISTVAPTGRAVALNYIQVLRYGTGDVVGIEGDNDLTDPAGKKVGTGVLGLSIQGIGVLGQGGGDITSAISPYIGVYGISQTNPTVPYPVNNEFLATGVFGIGDIRGGVFQTTPHDGARTFANVQLTPLKLQGNNVKAVQFQGDKVAPQLPTDGQPGDILAVDVQLPTGGSDPSGIQLWVCIKQRQNERIAATWARILFDLVMTEL